VLLSTSDGGAKTTAVLEIVAKVLTDVLAVAAVTAPTGSRAVDGFAF